MSRLRRIALDPTHRDLILEHARETYPHECCGFLVGERGADGLVVLELARAKNAREDSPANRYLIPPEEFLAVQRGADRKGLDIVGFYHSHPDAPARPSAYDRDHAWTGYAYLIAGVERGIPRALDAFELVANGMTPGGQPTRGEFEPMELSFETIRQALRPAIGGTG